MSDNRKKLTPPSFTAEDIMEARKRGIPVKHLARETLTIGNHEIAIPTDILAEGHIFIVGVQRVTLSDSEFRKLEELEAEEGQKSEEVEKKQQVELENKNLVYEAIRLLVERGNAEADYSSEYQELATRFKDLKDVNRLLHFLAMEKIGHSVRLLELADQLKKQTS
jgi:hypothetical protein